MKWTALLFASVTLVANQLFAEDKLHLPRSAEVGHYELTMAGNQKSQPLPRQSGDELLNLLNSSELILAHVKYPPVTNAPYDPAPPYVWLSLVQTNGYTNTLGLIYSCSAVHADSSFYAIDAAPAAKIQKVLPQILADLEAPLKKKILGQPKPFVYEVGTLRDVGSLSQMARLFYGDARKWPLIAKANRKILKNPNELNTGMNLVIPAEK